MSYSLSLNATYGSIAFFFSSGDHPPSSIYRSVPLLAINVLSFLIIINAFFRLLKETYDDEDNEL